ncbi:MAG: Maf family protein [Clostridia bacterium]
MNDEWLPLVLASASPRRRELLSLYGIPFEVIPSQADECAQGEGRERVLTIARQKCDEVAARYPSRLVLAADTLVCVNGEIMGKPKDAEDAARMLALLSGRTHEVHTGLCIRCPDGRLLWDADTTRVQFLPLDQKTIRRYVATGEPMDKAGAYAIQGVAGVFVSAIEGSPSNVVGLPLGLLTRFLGELGLELLAAPAADA